MGYPSKEGIEELGDKPRWHLLKDEYFEDKCIVQLNWACEMRRCLRLQKCPI